MNRAVFKALVYSVFLISPTLTLATGIPTVDVAAAAILQSNAFAQATQALDALNNAKNGIEQARQQYENYKSIVSGNDKLGSFLNNPSLNTILPLGEWSEIYSSTTDIIALRKRYGLVSEVLSVQQKFDMMLTAAEALERIYNASTERVYNAEALRAKLNEVETPQQKSDLQLRYQQEMLEQQNQQMRIENIRMLQQQQEKIMDRQRARAFMDRLNGKPS